MPGQNMEESYYASEMGYGDEDGEYGDEDGQ